MHTRTPLNTIYIIYSSMMIYWLMQHWRALSCFCFGGVSGRLILIPTVPSVTSSDVSSSNETLLRPPPADFPLASTGVAPTFPLELIRSRTSGNLFIPPFLLLQTPSSLLVTFLPTFSLNSQTKSHTILEGVLRKKHENTLLNL